VETKDDKHRDSALSGSLLPWGTTSSPPTSPQLGVSGSGTCPGLGSAKSINKSNGLDRLSITLYFAIGTL